MTAEWKAHLKHRISHHESRCFWCETSLPKSSLTVDHVTPQCVGGTDDASNLRWACERCNGDRGKVCSYFSQFQKLKNKLQGLFDRRVSGLAAKRLFQHFKRANKTISEALLIQAKWKDIEMEKLGFSPTAAIDLSLPDKKQVATAFYSRRGSHGC